MIRFKPPYNNYLPNKWTAFAGIGSLNVMYFLNKNPGRRQQQYLLTSNNFLHVKHLIIFHIQTSIFDSTGAKNLYLFRYVVIIYFTYLCKGQSFIQMSTFLRHKTLQALAFFLVRLKPSPNFPRDMGSDKSVIFYYLYPLQPWSDLRIFWY